MMDRTLYTARILLITATTFTFALTGFTFLIIDEIPVEDNTVACGTVAVERERSPVKILDPQAQYGMAIFQANCKSCHRMEKELIGPPLNNVLERIPDSNWVRRWIVNSAKMIEEQDPYAVALFKEYKGAQMTNFTTMSNEDIDALIAYLKQASQ